MIGGVTHPEIDSQNCESVLDIRAIYVGLTRLSNTIRALFGITATTESGYARLIFVQSEHALDVTYLSAERFSQLDFVS